MSKSNMEEAEEGIMKEEAGVNELRMKLEELLRREQEVNGMRKDMNKDYKDQLLEIRGEIKDTLKKLDGRK